MSDWESIDRPTAGDVPPGSVIPNGSNHKREVAPPSEVADVHLEGEDSTRNGAR